MKTDWIDLLIYIAIGFMLFLIFTKDAHAYDIDLEAIATIESAGNADAINERTKCWGMYQISKYALYDYNKAHNSHFILADMLDATKAEKVAIWYLETAIPRYLRHYGLEVNDANVCAAYNWGVGNLVQYYKGMVCMPKETENYIRKYGELKGRC